MNRSVILGGPIMSWNISYETGVPVMDEQHKELFRQFDILLDPGMKDRVPSTLRFLGDYVVKHFSTEEMLQARSGYPKAAEHKKQHADFIAVYVGLKADYEKSGDSPIMLMKITRTVLAWLNEHIRRHDKEFAVYYKGKME